MRLEEKYRPKTYDEIIGQDEIINKIQDENPESRPHKLFVGQAGTGKTTLAQVYAKEIGYPIEEFNAGDKRRIDDVRTEIKRFASFKTHRIIFLDEGDSLTVPAQEALRRIMEKTKSTIFIITGNYPHKLIEPIQSRCTRYNFKPISDYDILKQIIHICKEENIEIPDTKGHKKDCDCDDCETKRGFFQIIKQSKGDLRKAINILDSIMGKDKKITKEKVMSFQQPNVAIEVFDMALNGYLKSALQKLEEYYVNNKLEYRKIIDDMFKAINEKVPKDDERALMITHLAITERACRQENSPLIQFAYFISKVWVIRHLNTRCPALGDDEE